MDITERNQLIEKSYAACKESLANLLANVQPAGHSTTPLSVLTEQISQDLVSLKIIAQSNQTPSNERSY